MNSVNVAHIVHFTYESENSEECASFKDIPNIGMRIASDFFLLGIKNPNDLEWKNAHSLYKKLERITREHHDPCVLDTNIAVIDFMNGAPVRP